MASLLEELERRESAIRERLDELRFQVAGLSEQLEAFEEMLAQWRSPAWWCGRFSTTRRPMTRCRGLRPVPGGRKMARRSEW